MLQDDTMSDPSRYAERLILLLMLLACAAVMFVFGGIIFVGILQNVSA
jgi:hypothetical protein